MEKLLMIAAAVRAGIVPPRAILSIALALTLTPVVATSIADPSLAQEQASSPATTGVMVIVTVKAGVAPERVMAAMPAEIQQTVQLYLNRKIREWYSRSDGRGVVLLLDAKNAAEAHAIMGGLPLSKQIWWTTSSLLSAHSCPSACSRPSPSVGDKCEAHLKAANGHNNQGAT